MYTYTYIFVLICAATCRTRSFASCPSRSSDPEIFKCCTPPLCALNPEKSWPQPRAPLASVCSGGITTYSWGPIGVGLPVCLLALGTPITRHAVVQASGCDPSAVAPREDRRAQEPEESVCRCAQRALHARRPRRRATMRRRFIDRCNLTKLPDSICDLNISSLYARPPVWRWNPIHAARLALQGRVEECPPRATGVRVQHEQPNVAVRAVIILEACVAGPSRALVPQERGAQRAASAA